MQHEIELEYHYTFAGLNYFLNETNMAKRQRVYEYGRKYIMGVINESKSQFQPMRCFTAEMMFNSRHDTDNPILVLKWTVDCLRAVHLLYSDKPEYYRGLMIVPDTNLKMNTYKIKIKAV